MHFDLEPFVDGKLKFFEDVDGQSRRFLPGALSGWLEDFAKSDGGIDPYPPSAPDTFLAWLEASQGIARKGDLKLHCQQHWATISEAMRLLTLLERRMTVADIGRIAITTADPDDEKKIFELINNAGSPLSAVEILSARPEWNEEVVGAAPEILGAVNSLFGEMGISRSSDANPRIWDVAATLIDRLSAPTMFEHQDTDAVSGSFERRITLGFQLYAGRFLKGISKKHIERLPREQMEWKSDALRQDLEALDKQLKGIHAFQRLTEWGHSVQSLTSEAVAIDFALRLLTAWERRNRPTNPADGDLLGFRIEAIHLIDSLVFEYVTREWRGSSDARTATDLAAASSGNDPIAPGAAHLWKALIDEVVDDSRVRGRGYTGGMKQGKWQSRLERIVVVPLLVYQKVIRNEVGPDVRPAIDHIIPQKLWKGLTGPLAVKPTLRTTEGNLVNLALLPPDVNLAKSATSLADVLTTDQGMANRLEKLLYLPVASFNHYSHVVSSLPDQAAELASSRSTVLKWDLCTQRERLVADPAGYAHIPSQ